MRRRDINRTLSSLVTFEFAHLVHLPTELVQSLNLYTWYNCPENYCKVDDHTCPGSGVCQSLPLRQNQMHGLGSAGLHSPYVVSC